MTAIKSKVVLGAGAAINKDMFYMSGSFDEQDEAEDGTYSRMFIYQNQTNEKWFKHDLAGWRVVSSCFPKPGADGIRKLYALSEQGDVECYSKLGATHEKIQDAGLSLDDGSANYGYVTRIREIGQHLYVCGYGGQVYRRDASGWIHVDQNLLQTPVALSATDDPAEMRARLSRQIHETTGLTDINGAGDDSIYVVGNSGFLAHFDGSGWRTLDRLTAAHLNAIHIEPGGDVWIVGSRGTVLRGTVQQGFKAVMRKSLTTDFYAIAQFQDKFYLGAGDGIYELHQGNANRLPESDTLDLTQVSCVEAKDGVLWALTERKLVRFDGVKWEVFENPYNV
uniref:hypothetical protein n=1 Tax=Burkholderia arboris TaxID=488730 RepID=UPI003BEEECE2